MFLGEELTWNLRDRHFLEVLQLVERHLAAAVSEDGGDGSGGAGGAGGGGSGAGAEAPRLVVWAHNRWAQVVLRCAVAGVWLTGSGTVAVDGVLCRWGRAASHLGDTNTCRTVGAKACSCCVPLWWTTHTEPLCVLWYAACLGSHLCDRHVVAPRHVLCCALMNRPRCAVLCRGMLRAVALATWVTRAQPTCRGAGAS